jgi:phage terminase small subunit
MARAAKTAKGLTEKQERFALAYFEEPNASAAYRKAYRPKKASEKTVNEMASRLLKDRKIAARIAHLRTQISERAVLTFEKTIQRLGRIVNGDVRMLFDDRGRLRDIGTLSVDEAAMIAGIESFEEYQGKGEDREAIGMVRKVKLVDVNPAIANAMRHFGAFEKDNKQRKDPVALMLEWVREQNEASGTHGLPVKY